jgi:integrating conjugative element membrane protein (TIGR03745 family)
MTLTSIAQKTAAATVTSLFFASTAFGQVANLPEVALPDNASADDFLSVLKGLASQGLTIVLFVVGVAAFVLVGWSVVTKFNECRAGRAEWSEAAVTAGIGAVILVFSTFLLGQASTFLEANI